ncbi:NADH-quinone oxidoreductase subunit K [Pseudohongiella sp. O18]|uniref:NADH-quinone oxidoreductase subunit K n=1 Tax=Pseudohongiella sp. O18 TaxID=2904248 RepID=UPI001F3B1A4A|nr:NADH-quinone oxidoreductase subunit K [Pseudohongiella sp. O18]
MSSLAANSIILYLLVAVALVMLGLYGLLVLKDPIRRLIAINIMGSGTFLTMIAFARRQDPPDPILHALVVTGLVVAISATAFALRLILAARESREAAASGSTEAEDE